MPEDNREKTIEKRLAEFDTIGIVRTRPGHDITTHFFAVSKLDFQVAEEAFIALIEKYGMTSQDMLRIREALAFMFYHTVGVTLGEVDLKNTELAAKVTWQ